MKPLKIVICIAMLNLAAAGTLTAAGDKKYVEEMDQSGPIIIGSVFYTKGTLVPGYQARYTHMGFEGANLRIKYELVYHTDEIEETEYYTLKMNGKDALLSTKPLFGEDPKKVTRLLLSVLDDFGRIQVQEFRGR